MFVPGRLPFATLGKDPPVHDRTPAPNDTFLHKVGNEGHFFGGKEKCCLDFLYQILSMLRSAG